MRFSLRLDEKPSKVYTNLGTEIAYEIRDGRVEFCLKKLGYYDVVFIEY